MRVVTYNIQYWTGIDKQRDPARTIDTVVDMAPDIIAMQEVVHPLPLEDGTPALARLARRLGGEYIFTEIWPAGTFPHIPAGMGLALVSRYPILAHASHRLNHPGPGDVRYLLEARLLLDDDRYLTVYVTHLEWRWEEVRVEQVRSLLLWTTRDKGKPHLLLGDFNAVHPDDAAEVEQTTGTPWAEYATSLPDLFRRQGDPHPRAIARLLKAGYVDAFRTVGEGDGRTYTTAEPTLRLDYCFVDPSIQGGLQRARRWESDLARVASDHFPLVVDMAFPSEQEGVR